MRQLRQPLYEILGIEQCSMPEVWTLVEQYPSESWYPHSYPQMDVHLLRLRYSATGEVQASLRDIGRLCNLTAERVRVRLNRIIAWIQARLNSYHVSYEP